MDRLPTGRWIVTRVELTVAVTLVLIVPIWEVARPAFTGPGPSPWETGLKVIAWLVMVGATAWMFRLSRRDPEAHPSFWRHANDD